MMFFGLMILAAVLMAFPGGLGRAPNAVAAADSNGHGFDLADLDTTCNACQDFFEYANGGWIKRNPIPPEYASWGRFNEVQNRNQEILRTILEAAAGNKSAADGSIEQKIGDFYSACMNTEQIEAAGIAPIQPQLDRVAAIATLAQLEDEVARLHSQGARVLFFFSSAQDDKNSRQMIAVANQGGLGLPDRDYYTKDDARSKQLREQYVQHIAKMMELAGDAPAQASTEAATVMSIETQLALASKTRVERRDPQSNYHKMDAAELRMLTPDFAWEPYFREIGFPNIHGVNVGQPEFFQALDKQLKATPIADWKIYLRWHLLRTFAPALSSKFVDENFNFYGRTLTGAKQLQPRWKRCVISTDRELGQVLGQKYVQTAFPPEAKARAHEMVENLVSALHSDIETLPWMSDPTRKQALAKLAAMNLKIGYPDKWRDYSAYRVTRDSYVDDLERGNAFEFHRQLAKIDKPVDRGEWDMTPPTVNAYYDPNMNEIVFPAGILQPPFFEATADDALNYGGIGAVIGHEMTHGFDDQGAPIRRARQSAQLVDRGRPEELQGAHRLHREAVRLLRRGRRLARKWQARSGREHRRSRRAHAGAHGFRPHARGKASAAQDRRLHPRAAILPLLRTNLGHHGKARIRAHVRNRRPAPPAALPCQRRADEHAGLRAGV